MRPAAGRLYAAILLGLAFLVSCKKPLHEGETYAFVTYHVSTPFWQEAQTGFKDAGAGLGIKTEVSGPAKFSPEDELKAFQDAVASHPSGILVSAAKADTFKDAIDAAIQAGIPVICIDSDAPKSHRVLFVGTNNYRAGMQSGMQMAGLLHGKGHVVVVSSPGKDNDDERLRGIQDAFKKSSDLTVSKVVNGNGDADTATSLISGLLQNHESIDGIICLDASGGPGVAKALDQAGASGKIVVVAMDYDPDTLAAISKGTIAATIAQKPYTMGYYGLKFLDDLHHNRVHEFPDWRSAPAPPLPTFVDTGTVVVTKQNVQDFQAALPSGKP